MQIKVKIFEYEVNLLDLLEDQMNKFIKTDVFKIIDTKVNMQHDLYIVMLVYYPEIKRL